MMALLIAASGGVAVGLAVGGLFGWFSRPVHKHHATEEVQDMASLSQYHSFRK